MSTKVHIILGPSGSGRRAIVADLIEGAYASPVPTNVYIHEDEFDDEANQTFAHSEEIHTFKWKIENEKIAIGSNQASDEAYFILNGAQNPIDQLESITQWLPIKQAGKIICAVHCDHLSNNPKLNEWYDALIHFSDIVLLNHRKAVSDKWIREFTERYQKKCYPCMFEYIRKGRIKNPPALLNSPPRRISQIFDERDAIDELEIDPENLPEEPFELTPEVDPYFKRLPSGSREKRIPDIARFLPLDPA